MNIKFCSECGATQDTLNNFCPSCGFRINLIETTPNVNSKNYIVELHNENDSFVYLISCPKCSWQPNEQDLWACSCNHKWNTFETQGECPACNKKWKDTACSSCLSYSKHDKWYKKVSLINGELRNGYGKTCYNNGGKKYIGNFYHSKYSGYGKIFSEDEDLQFEGNWKDGKAQIDEKNLIQEESLIKPKDGARIR